MMICMIIDTFGRKLCHLSCKLSRHCYLVLFVMASVILLPCHSLRHSIYHRATMSFVMASVIIFPCHLLRHHSFPSSFFFQAEEYQGAREDDPKDFRQSDRTRSSQHRQVPQILDRNGRGQHGKAQSGQSRQPFCRLSLHI